MSGPVKVAMCLNFPKNFKFDPDLVRAFYMKGELHVVFPYSKDWMDLKKRGRYPISSSNLPQKCLLRGSISTDTWRWGIKLSDLLDDVDAPTSIVKELYKKIFGNRRS